MDTTIDQHGHKLINFLKEANFCELNGIFPVPFPDDYFTCISYKGKSVDDICVPIDVFRMITNFTLATVHAYI